MVIKELRKVLIKEFKKVKITNTKDYINILKASVYYIGKSILILCINDFNENNLFPLIDKYNVSKLHKIFSEMERKYYLKNILSRELKEEIIKILLKYSTEEVKNISLGELYESLITSKERKYLGQVYTPRKIVKKMINDSILKENIIKNPYYKIIDPACGAGYFIIEAYESLYKIFLDNYSNIIKYDKNIASKLQGGIHKFIIENNLWGRDIDSFAIFMTVFSLLIKDEYDKEIKINIVEGDTLIKEDKEFRYNFFDLVIGNPPYIGHKKIDKSYRDKLKNTYFDVYYDKSDLSYCFFKRGYELLKRGGRLSLITSRYFLESPSGAGLRKYLKKNYHIEKIVDYYGYNVFKGVGISPVILNCIKDESIEKDIHIYKLEDIKKSSNKDFSIYDKTIFNDFYISKDNLDDEFWLLMDKKHMNLYCKINTLGDHYIHEVCSSNQGIITGCDKAFIVDRETIMNETLEDGIIKPWIKSSNIKKYSISNSSLNILYTDLIDDIEKFPNVLNHINPYKEKLSNRRECLKGIRKWYELQWGRDINIFKSPKIIFPYKASSNKFALVYDEIFFSADIYVINIKEERKEEIPIEYLLAFLNSSLFEFYFKSVGKKLDKNLYDYYPNKIMNLRIKIGYDKNKIKTSVIRLLSYYKKLKNIGNEENRKKDYIYEKTVNDIKYEINFINNYFYGLYNLTDKEIEVINKTSNMEVG